MGIELIISLIVALIGYFGAKKGGASDAQAAGIAAAMGAGTYYVATETDWGKSQISALDKWWNSDVPVQGEEGVTVKGPSGAAYYDRATGKFFDLAGKVVDNTGDVLKDWGATGTSAVIGTTAAVTNPTLTKYLPWLLFGGLALLILR